MARSPVRMPAGVQNVDYSVAVGGGQANYDGARISHPLFMLPQLDPFRLIVSQQDFVDAPSPAYWTTTVVGTGTSAKVAGEGGIQQLTTNNATPAATDSVEYQRTIGDFAFDTANQMWFHSMVIPQDSTNSTFIVGLQNVNTAPGSATDGVWFRKQAASQLVDLVVSKASAQTVVAGIGSMADLTSIKLSYYYDGKGTLNYYVNNNKVGSLDVGTGSLLPLSATALSPTFYVLAGAAAQKYLQLDYFLVAHELVR